MTRRPHSLRSLRFPHRNRFPLITRTFVCCAVLVLALSGCGSPSPTPTQTPSGGTAYGCSPEELTLVAQATLEGKATYYGDSLAGNHTANGDVYDPTLLTAAHKTLPFGTRVRVIRQDQERPTIVCLVINDRGPFAGSDRIIDVSRRAAELLDMIRAGVVPVRVDVL